MRVKVTLSYDGSKFNGFQIQNSGVKTVENKIQNILKSLGIDTKINSSGRTDTGVHATNQVIDFSLPPFWSDLNTLKNEINTHSLPDIYIKNIKEVSDSFHARYCAKKRVYRYIITTKTPSVFMTPYIHFVSKLDVKKIQKAIKCFEGEHDFSYFKKTKGGSNSCVRVIYKSKFYRYRGSYIFYFEANGYLRAQIRMMVYALLQVSDGKLSLSDLNEQLLCIKRHCNGVVIPNGLYLSRIKY